ncbi:hypothetical protein SACS_1224 [Parasaccharibacter apium]|uniref:Uncharacterized protein n=1 Tax=Parasaccharibacter apium TaxID=1510841 RepID=A0A7U7G6A5_9PROT|nr:hypothetical protein SACS_1224 [Parasaccharibacter apium]
MATTASITDRSHDEQVTPAAHAARFKTACSASDRRIRISWHRPWVFGDCLTDMARHSFTTEKGVHGGKQRFPLTRLQTIGTQRVRWFARLA